MGLRRRLMVAMGGGVTYLLRDEFTDTRAAGSVDGTLATPGPGTRTVVDTGAKVSVGAGALSVESLPFSWDDPVVTLSPAITRAPGVGAIMSVTYSGFDNHSIGFARSNAAFGRVGATTAGVYDASALIPISSVSLATQYDLVIVFRSAGAYFVRRTAGSADFVLKWIGVGSYAASVAVRCDAFFAAYTADWLRVAQLPAPWDTDYGIATQRLAGARSPGDTFTHEADAIIEHTVTTLPGAGQTELAFREQDTSNYWMVTVDSTGLLDLDEVVAGSASNRGSAAGVIANGDRIVIICDDEVIKVYEANVLRITYSSAANFKTATAGRLITEGTAGAVADIVSYPRTLSGSALSTLQRYAK